MNEIKIDSMPKLIDKFNAYPNSVMFRGQANSNYELSSSLERLLGKSWTPARAILFEDEAIKKFKSKYHLYDNSRYDPKTKLAWLGAMQHFGVPTRLIDFTTSPYVALYFALESYPFDSAPDFSIFAIDYSGLMQASIDYISSVRSGFRETLQTVNEKQDEVFQDTVDSSPYDIAWIAEPQMLNVRLDRQEGTFLLSGNREKKISDILEQQPRYNAITREKLVISGSLRHQSFGLLRKANVTSKSIYGDLSGLAKSIRMELQAYA